MQPRAARRCPRMESAARRVRGRQSPAHSAWPALPERFGSCQQPADIPEASCQTPESPAGFVPRAETRALGPRAAPDDSTSELKLRGPNCVGEVRRLHMVAEARAAD